MQYRDFHAFGPRLSLALSIAAAIDANVLKIRVGAAIDAEDLPAAVL